MSAQEARKQVLDYYTYYATETPLGNWEVRRTPDGNPLAILPDQGSAERVASTLNAEYTRVYDQGVEDGYDVGYHDAKGRGSVEGRDYVDLERTRVYLLADDGDADGG